MESKKNTFQIVLICILTVLVLFLTAALYRSWRVAGELQVQLAEAQNNMMTVENEQETQPVAAVDNTRTVRVMNGIVQLQDENGQWLDVAPVEELQQADPVLAGRTKMENLITQNKEAVQNGTIDEEQISSILSKQSALMGASLARSSQVQSAAEKTAVQQTKPTNAAATVTEPIATPVPTAQPAIGDSSDSGSSGGGSSDSGSSDSGSSGGGSSDSGSSGGDSSDSGSSGGDSSDSGSSDSGSSGGDSSDSGDGEDIGWTDEVL